MVTAFTTSMNFAYLDKIYSNQQVKVNSPFALWRAFFSERMGEIHKQNKNELLCMRGAAGQEKKYVLCVLPPSAFARFYLFV